MDNGDEALPSRPKGQKKKGQSRNTGRNLLKAATAHYKNGKNVVVLVDGEGGYCNKQLYLMPTY
jgi:hypothetical protein